MSSGRGGERGGKYFGGKAIELGTAVGEIESTEIMSFGNANSIEDIISILNNLPDGALKNSAKEPVNKKEAIEIVKHVKKFIDNGEVVPGGFLGLITGEQGFRAAVIREIIKSKEQVFAGAGNLDKIIKNLENIITQNTVLEPFKSGLISLKDSSGSLVDTQRYIDELKYIKNWMAYNQGQPVENSFYMRFTGNYGLREAIMRATGALV